MYIYPQLEIDPTNFILGKDTCLNSVEMFYMDSLGVSWLKNFGHRLHSPPPITRILIYPTIFYLDITHFAEYFCREGETLVYSAKN